MGGKILDELRARVSGAYRTVNYGMRPLGALTGGLLASVIGLRAALWVAAAGGVSCVLWVVRSPLRHLHSIDDPPTVTEPLDDDDLHEQAGRGPSAQARPST